MAWCKLMGFLAVLSLSVFVSAEAVTVNNGLLEVERSEDGTHSIRWMAGQADGDAFGRTLIDRMTLNRNGLITELPPHEETPEGIVRLHPDCAELISVRATEDEQGRSQLRTAYRLLQPDAGKVECIETLTLFRDQPIVEYRMTFNNRSDTGFYVGEHYIPYMFGYLTGPLSEDWVARSGQNWTDDDRMGSERLAWMRKRCASVQARNGHGIAFSVLTPGRPIQWYWDFDRWSIPMFEPNQFWLGMVGEQHGGGSINESVQIPAGESESMGFYIMAFKPGMDAHRAMLYLYEQLSAGEPMALPADAADRFPRDESMEAPAPEIMSPENGAELTDIAVTYRWQQIAGCYNYEIEVADNPEFADAQLMKVRSDGLLAKHKPEELLPPGTWYWRIRARQFNELETPGTWSSTRMMKVNNDHSFAPPIRQLDAANPMIVVRDNHLSLPRLRKVVPRDLNQAMAVEFYTSLREGGMENPNSMAFCRRALNLELNGFLPFHDFSLAELEWAFQHCPNILGVAAGERFYYYPNSEEMREHARGAMILCRKYGRLMLWPDMHKYSFLWLTRDPVFGDARHAPYFIPMHKSTNPSIAPAIQSQVLGWWISGLVDNFGMQVDPWYWTSAGFRKLGENEYLPRAGEYKDMPGTVYIQHWLLSAMQGGSVLKNECDQPWDNRGNTNELWTRYYLPFFRGIMAHDFIPSKEQAQSAVKIAIRADVPEDWWQGYMYDFKDPVYGPFAPLYETLYGVTDVWKEWIPNQSRYHFIPLIPPRIKNAKGGAKIISVNELQDPDKIRTIFDKAYPKQFEGDAFVSLVDRSIAIMTTAENEDVTQDYSIPLQHACVKAMRGEIGPHAYIMAKQEDDSFWLQANTAYPERQIKITFTCTSKPTAELMPAEAGSIQWNDSTRELSVNLDHTDGAVEIMLQLP